MPCEECEKIREQHPGGLCGPCAKAVYAYVDACHVAEARLAKVMEAATLYRELQETGMGEGDNHVRNVIAAALALDAALAAAQPGEEK